MRGSTLLVLLRDKTEISRRFSLRSMVRSLRPTGPADQGRQSLAVTVPFDWQDRMAKVDELIMAAARDLAEPLDVVTSHLIQAGGKRVRPAFALIAGQAGRPCHRRRSANRSDC